MINLSNKKVSVYKGDYKPVNAYKNTLNLGGYKTVGMDDNKGVFNGTYNDFVTLYGKCGYKQSKNLCPTPKAESGIHEEGNERYSWTLTPKSDGRFDFWGAMATGYTISQVTLPAGTYSASGCELVSLWWEENGEFQTLPCTFTLEKESNVQCVLWYTNTQNITLENQYIQIEKGEDVTDFAEYCGDPSKPPSPDNIKQVIGAKGKVTTKGKNLFEFKQGAVSGNSGVQLIESLDNGAICQGVISSDTQDSGWANGWYTFANRATTNLKAGDVVTVSCDYTVLELAEGHSMDDFNSHNKKKLGLHLYHTSGTNNLAGLPKNPPTVLGEPTRLYITYTVKADGSYYPIITLNSNKVKIENIQVEYGDNPTEYYPYFGAQSLTAPELLGIEVTSKEEYNYTETVNGVEKYYICDSLEGNKLTQRIGKRVFDGTENGWVLGSYNYDDGLNLFVIGDNDARRSNIAICTHFNRVNDIAISNVHGAFSNDPATSYNQRFLVSKNLASNLEEWKAWLAKQYSVGRPISLYYALTEPIIRNAEEFPKTFPRATTVLVNTEFGKEKYGLSKAIKVTNV